VLLKKTKDFCILGSSNALKTIGNLVNKTISALKPGKTPEEIRKTFNIKNDFTPEEEEQVRFILLLILHFFGQIKCECYMIIGFTLECSSTEGQK